MNELINDMRWLACALLFICAICDANDDLGAYTACRYSYDSTGNRTEKDCDGQKTRYAYNSLDQLTEEQTATGPKTTYRWDGRGNLLEKSTPAQTIRYEWSSDNRLLKASDGSTSIRYGYDALGRRISRTRETGGQKQETQWILDTARPYSEIVLERSRQNGGAWQETRYTHTPDGVGQLISEQRQGKTLHVYEDGQGSARLITDESGQIIETLDFDAFGNESNPDPASPTRHRYTGESYDSATGLYHLRARDYDPKTGRFISMDEHPGSQSIPLTLNKYLYGNADPVNHIDPSGNMSLGDIGAGLNIQGILGTSAFRSVSQKALDIARKSKTFDIYDYVMWPLHFYMFAESKTLRMGIRYDIGNNIGWGGMLNFRSNPFGEIDGGFIEAQAAQRKDLRGKSIRIAKHTLGQWLTWHVLVVGSEQITCKLDKPYSFNPMRGTNCLSWTMGASAKAVAISRLPL